MVKQYMRAERALGESLQHARIFREISKNRFRYILVLPAIISVIIFQYLQWFGIGIAFVDFDIIKGFSGSRFVGLENFVEVFTTPHFLKSIINTLIFSSVNIFLGFPLPVALALLINEINSNRFKRTVQTISYLPHFLSWISVITLFSAIFALEGPYNEIKALIFGSDSDKVNILANSSNFVYILFFSNQWKNVGWNTVIYLAAISAIDVQLYEAAIMDGCGKFKRVFHITLPGIANTVVICLILATGGLISSNFEQVFGFQNTYIQEETEVISTLVYRQGIMHGNYSLATALGMAQGIVSFFIVYTVNKLSKRISGIGIW